LKDNFSDYLLAFRLKKACLFLELPQYKVSDVSQMVGFKDATYFSTVFKKAYNTTPLEYKNTAKKLYK
jgi:response regulator